MIRLVQHSALIIAFLGLSLIQKMNWEWRVAGLPPGPPPQCVEVVLPPLPTREAWLAKRVQPLTQPASPMEGAEAEFYIVTGYAVGDEYTPREITADGRKVRPGITIACPEELALGIMVYIEGIGARVCEDRGSAIVGKHLDIAFKTPEAAMLFGKQRLAVAVIKESTND